MICYTLYQSIYYIARIIHCRYYIIHNIPYYSQLYYILEIICNTQFILYVLFIIQVVSYKVQIMEYTLKMIDYRLHIIYTIHESSYITYTVLYLMVYIIYLLSYVFVLYIICCVVHEVHYVILVMLHSSTVFLPIYYLISNIRDLLRTVLHMVRDNIYIDIYMLYIIAHMPCVIQTICYSLQALQIL